MTRSNPIIKKWKKKGNKEIIDRLIELESNNMDS